MTRVERPWRFEKYGLKDASGEYIPIASPWQEETYTAEDSEVADNLNLIVTAVNECDALQTIEGLVRDLAESHTCPDAGGRCPFDAINDALATLDALRVRR